MVIRPALLCLILRSKCWWNYAFAFFHDSEFWSFFPCPSVLFGHSTIRYNQTHLIACKCVRIFVFVFFGAGIGMLEHRASKPIHCYSIWFCNISHFVLAFRLQQPLLEIIQSKKSTIIIQCISYVILTVNVWFKMRMIAYLPLNIWNILCVVSEWLRKDSFTYNHTNFIIYFFCGAMPFHNNRGNDNQFWSFSIPNVWLKNELFFFSSKVLAINIIIELR